MAQTGFTPILLYSTSTAAAAPAVGNLTNSTLGSELAINITDGKLFYKDNANAIQVIGWKVVPATAGGTGQTSYAVGDILYANTTTTLAKLADVATGNALISGGVGVAPSWGKIGLTTHVSGTLPTANGGTNLTSFTANGIVYASSTSALATSANLAYNGTDLTLTSGNFVVGTSGKGIDFSITSHPAGMTSELLADYEEGTWTPTLVASGGGASAADFTGRYTKIGNVVYFNAFMNDSGSNNFGTGTLTFGGLPYTCGSAASQRGVVSVVTRRITKPATSTQLVGWVNGSATTIGLYWNGTDGNLLTALNQTDISAGSQVLFAISGFYQV
jgi:hypothetical protein